MVSLKPLLTKQIISSKEKLFTQNNIVPPFTEQSICLLRGKLLYDNRNPLRSSACTLKQPFLCSLSSSLLGFLGYFYFTVTVTFTVEMCAVGWISCLPENEHIYTLLFDFLVKTISMTFCVCLLFFCKNFPSAGSTDGENQDWYGQVGVSCEPMVSEVSPAAHVSRSSCQFLSQLWHFHVYS